MNLIDCHCHTANSPDGEGSVIQLCERACELGLKALGVSEHCEANRLFSQEYYGIEPKNEYEIFDNKDIFEKSVRDNTAAADKFSERLNMLCGIELGQPYADFENSEKLISDERLDFVIASAHELVDKEDFETLLADHIKDAIIAINHTKTENKSILVRIGKISGEYAIYILDSGMNFPEEVINKLGKQPITTHKEEGGTGLGFMNTFKMLHKTKASLIIQKIGEPCNDNYTKVLKIIFDGREQFKNI